MAHRQEAKSRYKVLVSFGGSILGIVAISFSSLPSITQSGPIIRKSLLHSFALDFLPLAPFFLLFFCTHSLLFSFSRAAFRLAARKGISARLQLVSVLQHHANHGRGKMMVEGKKYDSDLILRLAVAAYQ